LNERVNDGVPDVYVLAVSSLQVLSYSLHLLVYLCESIKAVRAKYGGNSIQLKIASELAVACVKKVSVHNINNTVFTSVLGVYYR